LWVGGGVGCVCGGGVVVCCCGCVGGGLVGGGLWVWCGGGLLWVCGGWGGGGVGWCWGGTTSSPWSPKFFSWRPLETNNRTIRRKAGRPPEKTVDAPRGITPATTNPCCAIPPISPKRGHTETFSCPTERSALLPRLRSLAPSAPLARQPSLGGEGEPFFPPKVSAGRARPPVMKLKLPASVARGPARPRIPWGPNAGPRLPPPAAAGESAVSRPPPHVRFPSRNGTRNRCSFLTSARVGPPLPGATRNSGAPPSPRPWVQHQGAGWQNPCPRAIDQDARLRRPHLPSLSPNGPARSRFSPNRTPFSSRMGRPTSPAKSLPRISSPHLVGPGQRPPRSRFPRAAHRMRPGTPVSASA